MAESDSRKIRAYRQASNPQDFSSEEDPLVELARIVSEDSGFQPRQTRAAEPVAPSNRDAFPADLETELLQELESSFAARPPQPPRVVTAAPRPVRSAARQDNRSDELIRDIEAEVGGFGQPAEPANAQPEPQTEEPFRSAAPRQPEQSWDSQFADPDFQPDEVPAEEPQALRQREPANDDGDGRSEENDWTPAPDPAPVRPRLLARLDRPAAHRRASHETLEPQFPASPLRDADGAEGREDRLAARRAERQERFAERLNRRQSAAPEALAEENRQEAFDSRPAGRNRAAGLGFAGGTAAAWNEISDDSETPARTAQPEWPAAGDYRGELRTTFGDMDEAQEPASGRGHHPQHAQAEFSEELEPSYSDPTFGNDWDLRSDMEDDEPRVAAASSGRAHIAQRGEYRRSRKTMVAVAGVLGVVLVGGAVAAFLRSDAEAPSGPPPVIAAQDGPVKVVPEGNEATAEETAGEAVYNRVAGRPAETEEQIVEGAEEPREISRIVLPAPSAADADESVVRPVGEEGDLDVGPRRVRTYLVRPDGTIVASSEAGSTAESAGETGQEVAALDSAPPLEPDPVQTTAINEGASSSGADPVPTRADTASSLEAAPGPDGAASADPALTESETAAEPVEPANRAAADATELAAADPIAEPAELAAATSEPGATATPNPSAEDLVDPASAVPVEEELAAAPAAAPELPPDQPGYVVQVSSQRSMEQAQASFAALQSSYPSILGEYQANIQQAEVADQGTYYRVRVGPWATRDEAIEVCEALQAAGGSCFVSQ